ncbi:hypothetical protein FB451DRAFT_1046152 [Mycena latifolia]|nr:hypothetical protein FB451DRAFT_1046152 [Mycena latifolia]
MDPSTVPPVVSAIPGPNVILGTSATAPRRRPTIESPVYPARAASGLYDSVADQILGMKTEALANIDYPDNFSRRIEEWSKNHTYIGSDGKELRTVIVGEIMGPALGTIIRAHGNFFARDGDAVCFRPIDDKTKVKDSIALGVPTASTVKMYNTFINQVICLAQVVEANADEDRRKGNVSNSSFCFSFVHLPQTPTVKDWTKPSRDGQETHDLDEAVDEPEAGTSAKSEEDPQLPGGDEIKLGAHYEPSLLPDYGGSFFNHVKSKLVQHDVRDKNNVLIPPWRYYEELKPGTFVLVLATLHCYNMVDDNGKVRKIYQVNAHSIRILDESDEVVEERTRPIAPDSAERAIANLPGHAASSSFDQFVLPTPVASPVKETSTPLSGAVGSSSVSSSSAGSSQSSRSAAGSLPGGTGPGGVGKSPASSTTASGDSLDELMEDVSKLTAKDKGKTKRPKTG